MKSKNLLSLISDTQYEECMNMYRKLLGYDKNTAFYGPHPDTDSLIDYLNKKMNINIDPSYALFMKDSNGCILDQGVIYSFKHEEQEKDVLFVNFDKKKRNELKVSPNAFIVGQYASAAIIYDKASNIYGEEDATGYAWAIYSHKYDEILDTFSNFLEVIDFLIDDLISFFKED